MLNGKKVSEHHEKNVPNHLIAGIIYVLLMIAVATTLIRHYNMSTGELTLGNKIYTLVKIENEED